MIKRVVAAFFSLLVSVALSMPALANHTDPRQPLSPTEGAPADGITFGEGTWTHIRNFPANPGTDLEFWRQGRRLFASSGTLGQADEGNVGQRILRLVNAKGKVRPRWLADHGSANCPTANPAGTTGLQHDVQVTPKRDVDILIDTTDALGRCHDAQGGGLELVDIHAFGERGGKRFKPREIGLTRHDGTSHNVTVDATRPWVVYNSNTDTRRPWIDVLNIRSCIGHEDWGYRKKRHRCRPKVYRMPFNPRWTTQTNYDPSDGDVGELEDPQDSSGGGTGCHDITAARNRLYCAAINGTAIFNVKNLTTASGRIRGERLPCKIRRADNTARGVKVTDCDLGAQNNTAQEDIDLYNDIGRPRARGWRFLGSVNHPGRETGNTNEFVRSDEGVAVSHEADGLRRRFMFVTDERGGGVVPGGATCTPGIDNPYGNGGMHVFNIANPSNPRYARMPGGEKAVFISDNLTASPTFCNIHVIEKIKGDQRVIMAWYSQGIKLVDYFINSEGRWTFDEVAAYNLPGANTWTAEVFKSRTNRDGSRTYWIMASDIDRGIDIVKWRGPGNRGGERAAAAASTTAVDGNLGLLIAALVLLPVAVVIGRRRSTPTTTTRSSPS